MKRIYYLLVAAFFAATLVGCGENTNPENENELEVGNNPNKGLVELAMLDRGLLKLSVSGQSQMEIKVDLSTGVNYIDQDFWNRYNAEVRPIQDRMNEQMTNQLGEDWEQKGLEKDFWTGYYYNVGCWNVAIEDITLVADKSLFGEEPGVNIADRFNIAVWEYVFDTEGNLVAYSEEPQKSLYYPLGEWIKGGYFCHQVFRLVLPEGEKVSLGGEDVTISLSITMSNGLKFEESASVSI